MRTEILLKLQGAKTLGDMLAIIQENYDVEKCNVTPIVRGTIISGLQMAVKMTNCKDKGNGAHRNNK